MLLLKDMVSFALQPERKEVRERLTLLFNIGDTAVALLKAGAETDKKDVDGCLAMDLAPDAAVSPLRSTSISNILLT